MTVEAFKSMSQAKLAKLQLSQWLVWSKITKKGYYPFIDEKKVQYRDEKRYHTFKDKNECSTLVRTYPF